MGVVKGQCLQYGGTFKSIGLKEPNKDLKYCEVKSGNGSTFMGLRNRLKEGEPKKKKGEKPKKSSAIKEFVQNPSVIFVINEQHKSDYVYESKIFRYKYFENWPNQKKEEKYQKTYFPNDCDTENFSDDDEVDKYNPSTSYHTKLTFDDCYTQKLSQNINRRKKNDSFNVITLENEIYDKDKKHPKFPLDPSLTKMYTDTVVYSYFGDISLNFDGIEFMYDFVWLNKEKTKCIFIIPKNINEKFGNFNSFIIMEFFGKRRLR